MRSERLSSFIHAMAKITITDGDGNNTGFYRLYREVHYCRDVFWHESAADYGSSAADLEDKSETAVISHALRI